MKQRSRPDVRSLVGRTGYNAIKGAARGKEIPSKQISV
jgi:hypothetical protein